MHSSGKELPQSLGGLRFVVGSCVKYAPAWALANAASSLLGGLSPLFMLLATDRAVSSLVAHRSVMGAIVLFVVSAVLTVGGSVGGSMTQLRLEQALTLNLQPQVMSVLVTIPWVQLEDPASQDAVARAQETVGHCAVVWDSLSALLRDALQSTSSLVFLYSVSRLSALAALAGLLPMLLLRRLGAKDVAHAWIQGTAHRRFADYLVDVLTTRTFAAESRLFGFAPHILTRWDSAFRAATRSTVEAEGRAAARAELASVCGTGIILGAAALLLVGRPGAAAVASGLLAIMTVFRQLGDIGFWISRLTQDGAQASDIGRVLGQGRSSDGGGRGGASCGAGCEEQSPALKQRR